MPQEAGVMWGAGLAGPAGIAAGFVEFVFQVGKLLLERIDFFFLGVDFGLVVIDVGAIMLLHQGLLGVAVILDLVFVEFALKNVQFLL